MRTEDVEKRRAQAEKKEIRARTDSTENTYHLSQWFGDRADKGANTNVNTSADTNMNTKTNTNMNTKTNTRTNTHVNTTTDTNVCPSTNKHIDICGMQAYDSKNKMYGSTT